MAEEKEKNKAHTKTAPVYAVKNILVSSSYEFLERLEG